MITEKNIYLFKAKSKSLFFNTCCAELRRQVAISKLAGLTVSKDP